MLPITTENRHYYERRWDYTTAVRLCQVGWESVYRTANDAITSAVGVGVKSHIIL